MPALHGLGVGSLMRRDCVRCGKYEQAPELDNGLCWDCATREDTPTDPFSEGETQDLLAKFFDTDKPVLHADDPDLDRISTAAWDVLQTSNVNPVTVFRVGSVPSRLETDDDGSPVIRALTVERLRQEMAVRACWYRGDSLDILGDLLLGIARGDEEWNKLHKKNSTARPPRDVIQNMLAMPEIPLPVLERIVEAPVYGPDGTVETRPGYHPSSRTYYAGNGFKLQPVSVDPSHTEVARAKDIIGELLNDFPFTSEADRLVAVAAMLGPFARSLIDGSTPLHLLEAPTPGTGKGLLADVVAIPSTGRRAATITEARNEEEWRKRITAMLRNGRAITLIDNIQARLESPALSAAITSPMWTDRLLGGNDIVSYPVRTIWMATGNNPALFREIARRTVRCRMDAGVDHPESRSGFLHALPDWAHAHRADLVSACLTLVQNWIAAGRPPWTGTPLGSLESWCRTMGGNFEAARLPGFLENLEDFRESSDEESAMWSAFLRRWWETYADREVTGPELFEIARDGLDLGTGTTRAQQTTLGRFLAQQRDRWYGDLRIQRHGMSAGRRRWALTKRTDSG
jgi:putative DNA primase/helicase